MEIDRYTFHIKRFNGHSTYYWDEFFSQYPAVRKRKELIENERKGYVYDHNNFYKLSEAEGLELLINFEYSECDDFIEWEYFIDAFKDTDHKDIIKMALSELENQLLKASFLIRLNRYKELFPKGIFINEVEIKISILEKGVQKSKPQEEEVVETKDINKKEILKSLNSGKSKIVNDYLGVNNGLDQDFDISEFLIRKKQEVGYRDIEKILKETVNTFNDIELDKRYTDTLIAISAQYRIFRFKQVENIITTDDEKQSFASFIKRILDLFNLIIEDYRR